MLIIIAKNVNTLSIEKQVVLRVKIAAFNVPNGILQSSFTQKGSILVGLGDASFVEIPPGVDGEYLQYDSSEAAGIKSAVPSFDINDTTNHLINGGFDFAQEQTPETLTTIADGAYGPDQWKTTRENADLQYVRQDAASESGLASPYYGQFKKITNAGKFLICQPLDYMNSLKFRGTTINFQLQMKASDAKTIKIAVVELQAAGTKDTLPTLVSAWGADGTDPTLGANLAAILTPVSCSVTTAWQIFKFTGSVPANSKNLLVMAWSDADFAVNDTLGMAEAGLYFGESQRSWTPGKISEEMNNIFRYCWKTFTIDVAPAQNAGAAGSFRFIAGKSGAGAIMATVQLPVKMRISPTVTTYNPDAANAQVRNSTLGVDCSATGTTPSESQILVSCTGHASNAVGDVQRFHLLAKAQL